MMFSNTVYLYLGFWHNKESLLPLTDGELAPGFTFKTNKSDQQSKQRFPFDSKGQKGRERGMREGEEWKEGEKEEGEEEKLCRGKSAKWKKNQRYSEKQI